MRSCRAGGSAAIVALSVALSGCGLFGGGGGKPAQIGLIPGRNDVQTVGYPDGTGLYLPLELDGFTRVDTSQSANAATVVARYRHDGAPGPAEATVRMEKAGGGGSILPFTGGGSGSATASRSGEALDRIVASMRASDPSLSVLSAADVFLLRFGVLQGGRQAVLSAPSGPDGARLVRLQVYCCVASGRLYAISVRSSPSVDTTDLASRFVRDLPWSADPKTSVPDIQ